MSVHGVSGERRPIGASVWDEGRAGGQPVIRRPPARFRRPCADCGRPFEAGSYARFGRCCRWKHQRKRVKYELTVEREALIRERYDSHVRGRSAEIAGSLGWPAWVVKRFARELGLAGERVQAEADASQPARA